MTTHAQVDITEDQTSAEQLRESFRGLAADKVRLCRATRVSTWLTLSFAAFRHGTRPPPRPAPPKRDRLPAAGDAVRHERCRRARVRLRGVAGRRVCLDFGTTSGGDGFRTFSEIAHSKFAFVPIHTTNNDEHRYTVEPCIPLQTVVLVQVQQYRMV